MYVTIVLFASLFFQGATISWDRVTQNSDGTPTTDLAGYMVHWGTEPGNYNEAIDVGNETHWEFNFDPGVYYFSVTAYDFSDNESSFSAEVVWNEKSLPVDSVYNDEVIIYPNPFYNILEINAVGTVEIFNMLGQSIKKIEVNGRQYVDLSYLPVGVYFFVCRNRIMKRIKHIKIMEAEE